MSGPLWHYTNLPEPVMLFGYSSSGKDSLARSLCSFGVYLLDPAKEQQEEIVLHPAKIY